MYTLKRSMYTETAHRLRGHKGLCQFSHGHSYKWTVHIMSKNLKNDMVMDFGDLKSIMQASIGRLDHALVVDRLDYDDLPIKIKKLEKTVVITSRPTAERMAAMVYREITERLPSGVCLISVTCRETRNNSATYCDGDYIEIKS